MLFIAAQFIYIFPYLYNLLNHQKPTIWQITISNPRKRMEKNLERYYKDFERPPFAPTFTPTEEEFADPISYVAKIRPDAEKYGLIKIIPPKTFHPPFCIDSSKFEFIPCVQSLNKMDVLFRLRIIFINKLVKFWQNQGQQFRIPSIDNTYIDLFRLKELVKEEGGHKKINEPRKWAHIAKTLGFKPKAGPSLKYYYNKWIYPFILNTSNTTVDDQMPSTSRAVEEDTASSKEKEKSSPQTRSQSRMMAGAGKMNVKPVSSLDQSSIKSHRTPIEYVVCTKCQSGNDEARLLLCGTCDNSLHIYCANPPMLAVPKVEWRCQKCVVNALKSVSTETDYFLDSNQQFNLNTFGEWANNYKQQYFKRAPCDVPNEEVEIEYWRNVIDIDKAIHVKYGSDLISSKVGSGFPRREDIFRGADAKEKQVYANHPWNLNNLPKLRESVFCHMNMDISGMTVPWVYVGMLFSTFCWHVEDHWTYSINYNHWGERKIWYGIPGDEAEKFDKVVRESVPELLQDQNDLLHHMTTTLNPRFLIDRGVQVYTVHQNAGEFVITLPRAYHAGYNEGLNFAEAVNFAPPDWLRMGRQCLENYANVRHCVFSHEELVIKMASVSNKMSFGMCQAALEELTWIVTKETNFQKKLTAMGLRESKFCKFEKLKDNDRECTICRTTLFCSGLVCLHEDRIVCMKHIDQLCDKCTINDYCLKFRYTLEDLDQMMKRLSKRTTVEQLKIKSKNVTFRTLRIKRRLQD